MIRLFTVCMVVGGMLAGSGGPVQGQSTTQGGEPRTDFAVPMADTTVQQSGRVALVDWPASLPRLLDEMGTKAPYLLPKVDSLALDYRYATDDSTSQWSFVLAWRPGANVLYRGDVMRRGRAPSGLRMTNVELRARVQADGEYVGDMIIAVDSMRLAPVPSLYTFNVTVDHDRVFLRTDAETARQALRQGATLDRLVVERMGFESEAAPTSDRRRRPDSRDRRRDDAPSPGINPDIGVVIGGSGTWSGDDDEGPDRRPETARGDAPGRRPSEADEAREQRPDRERQSGEEDEASQGPSDTSTDEEEDDDPSLRLPAVGAAAAVGLVAYVGGTVGLYGRGDTPLGLTAGYTRPSGGVQLQAAVNGAVLEGTANQKMTVKALGFYDAFGARLQPAVGLGGHVETGGTWRLEPAVSLGLAANFRRVVVFGGVDVVQQTPEVGLTYNFRAHRAASGEEESP